MVEKLTEQNLQLEENLQELQDEKADLVRKSSILVLYMIVEILQNEAQEICSNEAKLLNSSFVYYR